jgi:general secretion pathway protein K
MRRPTERGGALISVLWLTAALAAIAFSVGALVRGEIERATNSSEGTRAYFLARGAMERVLHEVERVAPPPGVQGQVQTGAGLLMMRLGHIDRYRFGAGEVVVELMAEAGKLNLNRAPPEQLELLLLELGVAPDRAALITAAIVDWRGDQRPDPLFVSQFDQIYLQRKPSFRPAHTSFREVEELLLVHGVTPEIFYTGYRQAPDGAFVPRPGLRDCVSAYRGSDLSVDILSAPAAVMATFGVPRVAAEGFVAERMVTDTFAPERLLTFLAPVAAMAELPGRAAFGTLQASGGRMIYTVRTTGRVNGAVRSIAALIQVQARPAAAYDVLRWEDQATIPAQLFAETVEPVVEKR